MHELPHQPGSQTDHLVGFSASGGVGVDERGYAKGRAKRAEILDAAQDLFGEVGYRGASLREIAARCGLTHPGLLHHFPTKEALLLAVLERRDEAAQAATGAAVSGADELAYIVSVVADNATHPGIVELFTTVSAEATASDHPAHAFFADRYRRVCDQLAEAYRAAQRDGALRAGVDPESAARRLVALMDGLQVQWLYDPSVDMAGIVAEHLRDQLLPPLPTGLSQQSTSG